MQTQGIVLIVDDAPENLAMLHEALDEGGYQVLIAIDGHSAIERVARLLPDVILLDAIMPGIDGFETCRRLKANPVSAHIPIVFMTGLTETDHVLDGFAAGGVDYLTKPIRPPEVLARIAAHVRSARLTTRAQQAVDATGHAMLSVDTRGHVRWPSPSAADWLNGYLTEDGCLPPAAMAWMTQAGGDSLPVLVQGKHLNMIRLASDGQDTTLLVHRRHSASEPAALAKTFNLTLREAEVLHWLAAGKTTKDIADILGMSPRTVDKHLQHIFEKLGVETRTSAVAMALKPGQR
jgi:DNA-binding NarL/FixJ family response regulator